MVAFEFLATVSACRSSSCVLTVYFVVGSVAGPGAKAVGFFFASFFFAFLSAWARGFSANVIVFRGVAGGAAWA